MGLLVASDRLVYILSNGGRASEMDAVMGQLRGLRTFVNVFAASEREVDLMLATSWHDPEDYLLYEIAWRLEPMPHHTQPVRFPPGPRSRHELRRIFPMDARYARPRLRRD